jgi:hypothetical protein
MSSKQQLLPRRVQCRPHAKAARSCRPVEAVARVDGACWEGLDNLILIVLSFAETGVASIFAWLKLVKCQSLKALAPRLSWPAPDAVSNTVIRRGRLRTSVEYMRAVLFSRGEMVSLIVTWPQKAIAFNRGRQPPKAHAVD